MELNLRSGLYTSIKYLFCLLALNSSCKLAHSFRSRMCMSRWQVFATPGTYESYTCSCFPVCVYVYIAQCTHKWLLKPQGSTVNQPYVKINVSSQWKKNILATIWYTFVVRFRCISVFKSVWNVRLFYNRFFLKKCVWKKFKYSLQNWRGQVSGGIWKGNTENTDEHQYLWHGVENQ